MAYCPLLLHFDHHLFSFYLVTSSPSPAVCFEFVHLTQAYVVSAQCVAACLGSKSVSRERATKIKLINLVFGAALTGWGSFTKKQS